MDADADKGLTQYTATFHTHFAAMKTEQALRAQGVAVALSPAPRALGASCGTCARFAAERPMRECLHRDYDALYRVSDGRYEVVCRNDADL